jgi:hypothetical protein
MAEYAAAVKSIEAVKRALRGEPIDHSAPYRQRESEEPWTAIAADIERVLPTLPASVRGVIVSATPLCRQGVLGKHGEVDLPASVIVPPGRATTPALPPSGCFGLTRSGARPLSWPHELPDPGISRQFPNSSPDSGISHRFPGSSPPSDTNPLRMLRPG